MSNDVGHISRFGRKHPSVGGCDPDAGEACSDALLSEGLLDVALKPGRALMTMLGCGSFFSSLCDSVIPMRKMSGDVGVMAEVSGKHQLVKFRCWKNHYSPKWA